MIVYAIKDMSSGRHVQYGTSKNYYFDSLSACKANMTRLIKERKEPYATIRCDINNLKIIKYELLELEVL